MNHKIYNPHVRRVFLKGGHDLKEILADLHTHSIISIHAYNTITELLDKTTIPYLAVTDHVIDFGAPILNLHTNKHVSHVQRAFKDEPRLIAGAELDIDTPLDNQYGLTLESIPLILLYIIGYEEPDKVLEKRLSKDILEAPVHIHQITDSDIKLGNKAEVFLIKRLLAKTSTWEDVEKKLVMHSVIHLITKRWPKIQVMGF